MPTTKRFTSLAEVMADLQNKAKNNQPLMNDLPSSSSKNGSGKSKDFWPTCKICNDTGAVLYERDGQEYHKHCECFKQSVAARRKERAAIPEGFENSKFHNFNVLGDLQKHMIGSIIRFIKELPQRQGTMHNSFGFVAQLGELEVRELPIEIRAEKRREFNSFGLGKTHLAAAAAYKLLEDGYTVKMINDVHFLNDLINAQLKKDGGEELERLYQEHTQVDILIWDELGRSKPSENKQTLAYRIINDRYLAKKPIIFTSNESMDTLEDKIGMAAVDRLYQMAAGNIHELKGQSYRRMEK